MKAKCYYILEPFSRAVRHTSENSGDESKRSDGKSENRVPVAPDTFIVDTAVIEDQKHLQGKCISNVRSAERRAEGRRPQVLTRRYVTCRAMQVRPEMT